MQSLSPSQTQLRGIHLSIKTLHYITQPAKGNTDVNQNITSQAQLRGIHLSIKTSHYRPNWGEYCQSKHHKLKHHITQPAEGIQLSIKTSHHRPSWGEYCQSKHYLTKPLQAGGEYLLKMTFSLPYNLILFFIKLRYNSNDRSCKAWVIELNINTLLTFLYYYFNGEK